MSEEKNFAFGRDDDDFHRPGNDPWEAETCWFTFNVPERKIAAWLYGVAYPNKGISSGGVFVWDDTAQVPWELPYYYYTHAQTLPEDRDLRDFTFPNSFSIRMLKPLMDYRLSYLDRDLISVDLVFRGITEPHPFMSGKPPFRTAAHFDQPGHITGEITLHGERIPVDCFSVRDRSWGPRPEHRGGRIAYDHGTASGQDAFLVFARPQEVGADGWEPVNHGYFIADGARAQIERGRRRVERDPHTAITTTVTVDAEDVMGRQFTARGTSMSRMFFPRANLVNLNSLVYWEFNSRSGWGNDQEVWRQDQWSRMVRTGMSLA